WKIPLAELEAPRAQQQESPEQPSAIIEPDMPAETSAPRSDAGASIAAETKEETAPPPAGPVEPRRHYRDGIFAGSPAPAPRPPAADIVIPRVPAPDGPGPEPDAHPEPAGDVPVYGARASFSGR